MALHRRRRTWSRERAFTLVEILISVAIVSIGLIGILSLVAVTLKTSGQVVERSMATTVARSVYEALRAGARQQSFVIQDSSLKTFRGFVFVHDGVVDG